MHKLLKIGFLLWSQQIPDATSQCIGYHFSSNMLLDHHLAFECYQIFTSQSIHPMMNVYLVKLLIRFLKTSVDAYTVGYERAIYVSYLPILGNGSCCGNNSWLILGHLSSNNGRSGRGEDRKHKKGAKIFFFKKSKNFRR